MQEMAEGNCPNCSQPVHGEVDSCPSCGTDLRLTVLKTETRTQRTPPTIGLDFPPGETFAGRFTIIERIGRGGMGVVYKALDKTLGGTVALKLIRPELSDKKSLVERFHREVRITRRITHPTICRVHDIGNNKGILYLSMEWIDGETLHELLKKAGTLKAGRALEIAAKIARGLQAAHEAGVIHRDLKPPNVMIDERGEIHLLDFGLAVEQDAKHETRPGGVLGTPHYMSPEQQRGEELDLRTDVYSLGLILRDMLLGMPPQPGLEVHPTIKPVLDCMLSLSREDRYPSALAARQAIQELQANPAISLVSTVAISRIQTVLPERRRRRWLAGGVAAVVLAAAGLMYFLWQSSDSRMTPEARVFYERGLHYLNDSESLPSLANAIQMLHRAENEDPDSALIKAQLAIAYWHRFHRERSTASRDEAERYIGKAHLIDPGLPELRYARALGLINEGKHDAAREELKKGLSDRPHFPYAWAYLGVSYMHLGDYAAGKQALDKAIEQEPGDFGIELLRGVFHRHFGEHEQSQVHYRRATELKPNSSSAWNNLGSAQLYTGQFEESIPSFLRSIEIKDNGEARTNLGTSYYFLGRFEESIEHYRIATELQPTHAINWGNLGDALLALERTDEARQAYRQAADLARERVEREHLNPEARQKLALYCAKARDESCAVENGKFLTEIQPDNAHAVLTNAMILCVFGRDEESLDWLKRAVELGASKAEIQGYPEFSRLEALPRFKQIFELAS